MCRRFSNRVNTICVLVLIWMSVYYVYLSYDFYLVYKAGKLSTLVEEKRNFTIQSTIRLAPKCLCQKETIQIREFKDHYNILIENEIDSIFSSYNLSRKVFEALTVTCDLYKVLRRGPHQKIISFSISDHNLVNLKYIIKTNIKRAKHFYPDWIVRVYHKSRLTLNEECEFECIKNRDKIPYDNTDICDVTKLPIDLKKTWDASYILSKVLRYLPVGDDMVDIFVSRDIVSCIYEREVAAVNEWITSGRHFHVMRDHPEHIRDVIGGLWGFFTNLDRTFSKHMLNIFTDIRVNKWYRSFEQNVNPDELILERFVWPLVNSSIIHDSYNCKKLSNYYPFPIKRTPESN